MAKIKHFPGVIPVGISIYCFFCPGCNAGHPFEVGPEARWAWNGSLDKPTFTPSLLINKHDPHLRCHLFMIDGHIQFLDDCYHELRGQTVEAPEWDD